MPANRKQKEVELKLGGLDFVLCFKTRGLTVLEQLNNQSLKDILESLQTGDVGLAFIVNGIAAGLAHDPRFKKLSTHSLLDRIETLIDSSYPSIGEALRELSPIVFDALMLGVGVDLKEQAAKEKSDSPLDAPTQQAQPGQ